MVKIFYLIWHIEISLFKCVHVKFCRRSEKLTDLLKYLLRIKAILVEKKAILVEKKAILVEKKAILVEKLGEENSYKNPFPVILRLKKSH